MFALINLKHDVAITGTKQLDLATLRGDVEFRHVSFAYPTRPSQTVLDDVSLKLPAGKIVALCGPSGSGKSTIAALLERFYDTTEGLITIDGNDVRDLDPQWLRRNVIGFIRQEPILFATTIMENIRYGKPDATDEEVYEAARQANAHDFIQSFPRQYDTVVGERGVTVSGGQKQRIAIARALLKNPQVLILDESTSALDSESEQVVQAALDRLSRDWRPQVLVKIEGRYWRLTHQHHGLLRGPA
ncbi:hypothetical protein HPB48_008136 [Haemaphysalis longicornis]|uniref:Mitochondrial potassium channel ATP-binding subunit n=1 Tax=Haemaphysalis longicornis TaxID=44386 RepID=A0A9J6FSL0_HAELO|nr:hypothetical protein HPB48_008136 [Haemaphysalis longicornis]